MYCNFKYLIIVKLNYRTKYILYPKKSKIKNPHTQVINVKGLSYQSRKHPTRSQEISYSIDLQSLFEEQMRNGLIVLGTFREIIVIFIICVIITLFNIFIPSISYILTK